MKVAISAESTVDLPKNMLKEFNIHTLPFTIHLNDKEFSDGEIEIDKIFEYVKENKVLPKTSAVNEYQFEEHFSKLLEEYEAIVHISLSSKTSSAYENAVKASKKFKNVFVVNSLTLSTGIALLAIQASKMAKKNKSAKQIFDSILADVPNVQASFILDRLDYLHKGGRCSALQLLGANLLKIKPQIALQDGKMYMKRKFRGKLNDALVEYTNKLLQEFRNIRLDEVFITYTTAQEEVVQQIEQILKNKGFKNIYKTRAGCTISSHCGEGCLGVLFMTGKKRRII